MTRLYDALDWFEYRVIRPPLCRLHVHTKSCRGRPDHWPLRGWWHVDGRWVRHG